jgi:hypothetical protein
MPAIPYSAWEQAVIVVLFVVMLLGLLAGFYGFIRSILKTIQGISVQFQGYITDRDKQWQSYFEDREKAFKERNDEVVKVLQRLVEKFDDHAEETTKAIATMQERTRSQNEKLEAERRKRGTGRQ